MLFIDIIHHARRRLRRLLQTGSRYFSRMNHLIQASLDPPFIPWLIEIISLMRSIEPCEQAQRYPKQVPPSPPNSSNKPIVNIAPPQINPSPLRRFSNHPPNGKRLPPYNPLPPSPRQIQINHHHKSIRLPPLPPRNNLQIPNLYSPSPPRPRDPHRRTRLHNNLPRPKHNNKLLRRPGRSSPHRYSRSLPAPESEIEEEYLSDGSDCPIVTPWQRGGSKEYC